MPSSPTESRLVALAARYDIALEAVLRDELARVASLLDECDLEVRSVQPARHDDAAEASARAKAIEAHGRLLDAMRQAKDATQLELQRIWKGQEVLAGYGSRSEATGTHVSTDV